MSRRRGRPANQKYASVGGFANADAELEQKLRDERRRRALQKDRTDVRQRYLVRRNTGEVFVWTPALNHAHPELDEVWAASPQEAAKTPAPPAKKREAIMSAKRNVGACVTQVFERFKLDDGALQRLTRSVVNELGQLRAAQNSFKAVKRSKRGQKPKYALQVFLGMLEVHCSSVGIKIASLVRAKMQKGTERFGAIKDLLACAGIRYPQALNRQWKQRIRFRRIGEKEFQA